MSIEDNQNLSFSAMGINGQMPLIFGLGISLLEKIDSSLDMSYYKNESVGTMVLVLKKLKKRIWKYLGTDERSKKATVWWDLSNQYPIPMNKYRKKIEQELYGNKNWTSRTWKDKETQKAKAEESEIKKTDARGWIGKATDWLSKTVGVSS